MSTAGKVLSVLVALVIAVWIVLTSAVAQININATQALEKVKADIVKVKADIAETQRNTLALRSQINAEQIAKERDLRLVRIQLSTAERQVTTTRETLSRVQIDLANYVKSAAGAAADLAIRKQEGVDLEKSKADEEATVKRLQGENADLLAQLTKLRDDFMATLKANHSELDSYKRPSAKPTARPASFVR